MERVAVKRTEIWAMVLFGAFVVILALVGVNYESPVEGDGFMKFMVGVLGFCGLGMALHGALYLKVNREAATSRFDETESLVDTTEKEITYPDSLVIQAFQVIRHLSQLSEALAFGGENTDVLRYIKTASDLAEHVAQEFLPDAFFAGDSEGFRRLLLDDVQWMMTTVDVSHVNDVLAKTALAYPKKGQLQELAMALSTSD